MTNIQEGRPSRPAPPAQPDPTLAASAPCILVGPKHSPITIGEVGDQRVYDRETLLDGVRYVFWRQAPSWARVARQREDIIQDSCIIALAKLNRAEEEHGCYALIPEALVWCVVRGALYHRSDGDGRHMSTESGQAREHLIEWWNAHLGGGGAHSMRAFNAKAEEIRLEHPKRRRPTFGYQHAWIELPVDYQIELARLQSLADQPMWDPTSETALASVSPFATDDLALRRVERRKTANTFVRGRAALGLPLLRRYVDEGALERLRDIASVHDECRRYELGDHETPLLDFFDADPGTEDAERLVSALLALSEERSLRLVHDALAAWGAAHIRSEVCAAA